MTDFGIHGGSWDQTLTDGCPLDLMKYGTFLNRLIMFLPLRAFVTLVCLEYKAQHEYRAYSLLRILSLNSTATLNLHTPDHRPSPTNYTRHCGGPVQREIWGRVCWSFFYRSQWAGPAFWAPPFELWLIFYFSTINKNSKFSGFILQRLNNWGKKKYLKLEINLGNKERTCVGKIILFHRCISIIQYTDISNPYLNGL